jgi:hypothetical protein
VEFLAVFGYQTIKNGMTLGHAANIQHQNPFVKAFGSKNE